MFKNLVKFEKILRKFEEIFRKIKIFDYNLRFLKENLTKFLLILDL